MVSETHPHDIELFEYVEGELTEERRNEVAAHLATCSVCTEQVALASAGREALRGAGALELPAERREQILRSLPTQERAPSEQRAFSFKAALVMVAVFLALAAVVGVLVNSNGGANMESSAGGTGGAPDAAATGAGGGQQAESAQARSSLFSSGSAAEIAEELQQKGFDASVQEDHVVVRGATKQQVREALADRAVGDVEVVVKNP